MYPACTLRFLRAGGHRQRLARYALEAFFLPNTAKPHFDIRRCSESSCTPHVHCASCAPAATGRDSIATPRQLMRRVHKFALNCCASLCRLAARALAFSFVVFVPFVVDRF